jgi:hypothetical protein
MKFRDLACEHLIKYKREYLPEITEDGIFHYRGEDLKKAHILPATSAKLNILDTFRDQFWSSPYSAIKPHKFFHHLNSSQALCINLFYPLIAQHKLPLFLQFLGITYNGDLIAQFEKESDLEKHADRLTSFDFWIDLAGTSNIFVEVKYTEQGFGKAKHDAEHVAKFRKTYLPLLENSRFLVDDCKKEEFFLDHYQILRNLVHITDTDRVVLLFPSGNSAVKEHAAYARDVLLTDAGRARLSIVHLEEFVSFLVEKCAGGSLDGYYQEFSAKYLPLK